MSELYNHLERLQGRPQQMIDQGVPFPTATQGVAASHEARRSRRLLLAIPLGTLVFGFMTVAAVVMVKPHFREASRPRSETTARALSNERHSVPEMPAHQEASLSASNLEASGKATDEAEKGVKDEPALKTMTTSVDGPREDAAPAMDIPQPTSALPGPHTAAAAKATELSIPGGEPKEMAHDEQKTTFVPQESPPEPSFERSAEHIPDPESVRVSMHRSADWKRAVSRETPPAPAAQRAAKKKSSGNEAGEVFRQVLVIAEEARRKGQWEEAEMGYREYVAQKSDPEVLNNLGAVLLAQGRFAEAEQVLLQARDRSWDPDIAANLAAAYWFQGKKEAACRLVFSFEKEGYMALTERNLGFQLKQCEGVRHVLP